MTWLYVGLGVSIGLWMVLGTYVFPEIKKTYREKGVFSNHLFYAWYVMWAFHHVPVALASWLGIWLVPVDRAFVTPAGLILFLIGIALFRYLASTRRYCWSRPERSR